MRENGVSARRRRSYRATTDSRHTFPIPPNLLARDFRASAPNTAWVGDVTFVATGEGWSYLAIVLDLFSRRIVGWALRTTNDTALEALRSAMHTRRVADAAIFHSDRGSPYASSAYREALRDGGMRASMSRKGDCWDNAVAESFFATLRNELTERERFATHERARQSVKAYIDDFYNLVRRHSTNDYSAQLSMN